jgi:hypothetical protein
VGGRILDPFQVVIPIVIRLGRQSPTVQPDANSATFTILGPLPEEVRLGADVTVYLQAGKGGQWGDPETGGETGPGGDLWDDLWSYPGPGDPDPEDPDASADPTYRFTGRVTDLGPEAKGESLSTAVVCVGRKADLGGVVIGDAAWSAETEAERVQRLSDELSALGWDFIGSGESWYLAARDGKRDTALNLVHETMSAGGLVWETPDGVVVAEPLTARAGADTAVALAGDAILDGLRWSQRIDRLVQRVVVKYGKGSTSEAVVGPLGKTKREATATTVLRDLTDAESFGNLILARWGNPDDWEAPVIIAAASLVDPETWDALMGLSVSQVLETQGVTPLPTPLPYGSSAWFVEGWTETWDRKGNGAVWQEIALAVSSFQRFRPDTGNPTVITEVEVTPASGKYGTARTITAVLSDDVTDLPIPGGVVALLTSKGAVFTDGTTDANGLLTLSLAGDDLNPGTYDGWTLVYGGLLGSWKASEAEVPTITVTEPDTAPGEVKATVSLGVSPTNVREGSAVTLSASAVLTDGDRAPNGTFTFQVSRNNGSSWSTVATKSVTDGDATATWSATRPSDPCRFRVTFDASKSGVANVTSGTKSVDVLGKTTRTRTYSCSWAATYRSSGAKRTDTSDLFQGYISGTNGDQRGLAGGFGISAGEWDGWTVTKVEVFLKYHHWWSASGGTALIGSHTYSSEPESNPSVNARRTKVTGWKRDQGKWVDITSWGKGLATGSLKGVCIGPAGSTGTAYYGTAYGTGSSRPQLRITGYRWE